MPVTKLPKPAFDDLRAAYRLEPTSVHECPLVDPTKQADDTAAVRMGEALAIALGLAANRAAIASARGPRPLFEAFELARFGRSCPHGLALDPAVLAAFLEHHYGRHTHAWATAEPLPEAVERRTGIAFLSHATDPRRRESVELFVGNRTEHAAPWEGRAGRFWQI